MKIYPFIPALGLFLLLTGCLESEVDQDGVPKNFDPNGEIVVMESGTDGSFGMKVETRRLNVNGEQISINQFLKKYCKDKDENQQCARLKKQRSKDMVGGKLDPRPFTD